MSIPSPLPHRSERPDLHDWLGRQMRLVIDQPLRTVHPRHEDIRYPVNYGYVPGTLSADGAPIDAYLLGVHEPVVKAVGIVIALVLRRDDIGDKLVAAPAGMRFSAVEIGDSVEFQERHFDSRIIVHKANS